MWLNFLYKVNADKDIVYLLIRTVIIYVYAIFLLRLGNKRFNFETAFDLILTIIIGAVLSRAINGPSTLLGAIAGSAMLIFLHWLLAKAAYHSHNFGKLVKGEPEIIIRDGKLNWKVLQKNQVTEADLNEMIREKLNHDKLEDVREARLERSGKISSLPLINRLINGVAITKITATANARKPNCMKARL